MNNEQDILRRAQQGDSEAFRLLVEAYQTQVYRLALRMGGDEFLIACSHFSAEEAEQLIERLHGELARQSDDRLKLDVAFGYHTVTEGPFDYIAVYHAADRDMYRNKRKNR